MSNLLVKTLKYIANNLEDDDAFEHEEDYEANEYIQSEYADHSYYPPGNNGEQFEPAIATDGTFSQQFEAQKNLLNDMAQTHYADGINASRPMSEIILMEPTSFKDILQAVTAVRQQKLVVLNLSKLERGEAQRSIDFLSGGIYIIDGDFEKINEAIFLFTPYCIKLRDKQANDQDVIEREPSQQAVPAVSYAQYWQSLQAQR